MKKKDKETKTKTKKFNLLVMGSICSSADVHVRDSLITEELGEREGGGEEGQVAFFFFFFFSILSV